MFVILCVIAGATSHTMSNNRKTKSTNQLYPNHYRPSSFIEIILDSSELESQSTYDSSADQHSYINDQQSIQHDRQMPQTNYDPTSRLTTYSTLTPPSKSYQTSLNICTLMSNIFSKNQLRFCNRHQKLITSILPDIIKLTRKECNRITTDLRWNCTGVDHLLDRSNRFGKSVTVSSHRNHCIPCTKE